MSFRCGKLFADHCKFYAADASRHTKCGLVCLRVNTRELTDLTWLFRILLEALMGRWSSIPLTTADGDRILLSASDFNTELLRLLLVTEADYLLALASIEVGGRKVFESMAMPILSRDEPTLALSPPGPGKWRVVYQTADANVTADVIAATN